MRYVELNSGGLQTSISSWMKNLSVLFECVLNSNLVSCYNNILLERVIYWILVHIVDHSEVLR